MRITRGRKTKTTLSPSSSYSHTHISHPLYSVPPWAILSPSHVVFGGHSYLETWLGLSYLALFRWW